MEFVESPQAEAKKLRILIYDGDADPGLNSGLLSFCLVLVQVDVVHGYLFAPTSLGFYAQNWTSSAGIPELESWRPWTRDGKIKMGGYVPAYAHGKMDKS